MANVCITTIAFGKNRDIFFCPLIALCCRNLLAGHFPNRIIGPFRSRIGIYRLIRLSRSLIRWRDQLARLAEKKILSLNFITNHQQLSPPPPPSTSHGRQSTILPRAVDPRAAGVGEEEYILKGNPPIPSRKVPPLISALGTNQRNHKKTLRLRASCQCHWLYPRRLRSLCYLRDEPRVSPPQARRPPWHQGPFTRWTTANILRP